jgi:hypothetical protein
MLSYTIELEGRNADKPRISREEAAAMAAAGWRVSIFDDSAEEYRLTIPYSTVRRVDQGTLTFVQ